MKSDAHLFISTHPLHPRENVAAKCGRVVLKAVIEYSWDTIPTGSKMEWPKGICAACIKSLKSNRRGQPEFVYAIRSRDDRASELVQERKYSDRADSNL